MTHLHSTPTLLSQTIDYR